MHRKEVRAREESKAREERRARDKLESERREREARERREKEEKESRYSMNFEDDDDDDEFSGEISRLIADQSARNRAARSRQDEIERQKKLHELEREDEMIQ